MKKVLVMAAEGVNDKDLDAIVSDLEAKGVAAEIASFEKGTFKGLSGGEFRANMDINEGLASAGDFEALVLPGGKDAEKLAKDREAVKLVGLFQDMNKVVASVCDGCGLMLRGIDPHGKRIAAQPEEFENVWGAQAAYEDSPVVVDGNLITSNGRDLRAFTDEVAKHIG
jgi:protease I